MVKPSADSTDGPEAKRSKIDPNETIMVKKVGGSGAGSTHLMGRFSCTLHQSLHHFFKELQRAFMTELSNYFNLNRLFKLQSQG